MIRDVIARRYGQALFDAAGQVNKTEDILKQLRFVVETLEQQNDLFKILRSPVVSVPTKKEIITGIWQGRVDDLLVQFLLLLIDKQREAYLPSVFSVYEQLFDQSAGRVEAVVTSALELPGELRDLIEEKLAELTGKKIRLKTDVDPELLAGLKLQIGDKRIDGSLRARLQAVRIAIRGKDTSSKGVTFS